MVGTNVRGTECGTEAAIMSDERDEEFVKIATIDDEVQAQLLEDELEERDIPHLVVSHGDTAYDGVFQTTQGWGHVEAPPDYHARIWEILRQL